MSIYVVKDDLRKLIEREGADCFYLGCECDQATAEPRNGEVSALVDSILEVIERAGYRLERT